MVSGVGVLIFLRVTTDISFNGVIISFPMGLFAGLLGAGIFGFIKIIFR